MDTEGGNMRKKMCMRWDECDLYMVNRLEEQVTKD